MVRIVSLCFCSLGKRGLYPIKKEIEYFRKKGKKRIITEIFVNFALIYELYN